MERDDYIAGLRQLADLLERNESLILPYSSYSAFNMFTHSKKELQDWAKAFPGTLEKEFSDIDIILKGALNGISIKIYGDREGVCERVVVGTREVKHPATPAYEAKPERIEIVEEVEWICGSLLADDGVEA